ncbi:hypothetical protein PPERSA_08344 [Pseudocohnilembus persalinus]|uniref:Prenylcysteine lyase domain-containing protein n=1 Tax=Pseudocohnilembus persalinus TaxID=266149 RepID=A0A0V0QPR0_PSEPJ|nr:hypothetical protein PPERSA_08344 [Pseudocohnilembus persalinus]|eukprot:KRX04129.1 hypothetical protein PPERSA_08344 [Pseudocohnilembus persalinus]
MNNRSIINLILLVLSLFMITCKKEASPKRPRIAIIGSGIGGASVAYNLEKTFQDLKITTFERSNRIGGRTQSIDLAGRKKELGADFIISDNFYVKELADELRLHLVEQQQQRDFGILKGGEFRFIGGVYGKFVDFLRMFWRYGTGFVRFLVNQLGQIRRFKKIYIFQEQGEFFETVEEFLEVVGQYGMFNMTAEQVFLEELGSGQLFADEVLDSVLSNFYNQNYNVNGFAGMLAAAGLQGEPKQIKEGTNAIADNLFKYKLRRTDLRLESEVQQIIYDEEKEVYHIKYYDHKNKEVLFENDYDAVIMAAPIESSKITFSKNINYEPENRKTQTIYKYIVASKGLNPEVFNLKEENQIPSSFMSPDRLFGKISVLGTFCQNCYSEKNDTNIYVFTGREELTEKEIQLLFNNNKYELILEDIKDFPYPDLADSIGKKLPAIVINQGLYYLNSMEFAASCMELEVISGVNIVNMIKNKQGLEWALKEDVERKNSNFLPTWASIPAPCDQKSHALPR